MFKFYFTGFFTAILFYSNPALSQSCVPTGLNGTIINLPCGATCVPLQVKVPHLKNTGAYILTAINYNPLPYTTATGNELTTLYSDDKFSSAIDLSFPFCYYDSVYTKAVIGSNGMLTFDESTANGNNAWPINNTIPYAGGSFGLAATQYYPPASVMVAYSDLDPQPAASPAGRKIEWRIESTAPCRRFVSSFYNVGTYGASSCSLRAPTTFEMVLYEGSGLIDFFIANKSCQAGTSNGRAIMGIQNWQRNKAVAGVGRNAVSGWTASNEGWRFIPSSGASRFIKTELYDLTGNLLQSTTPADTATTTAGILDVNFSNVCITAPSKQFVIKTYYSACPSGGQLISIDTITVNKGTLTATTSSTAASCGPNGSATIILPAGGGPYTYTLATNAPLTDPNNTHTFTGLTSGSYTITASNAAGCTAVTTIAVASTGGLSIQALPTATSCAGAANGHITVTPQNGIAPFQYTINNGPYQASNTFNGLAAGSYMIGIKDAGGCQLANYAVTVAAGSQIAATATPVNVRCNGGNNGSLSVSLSANATAPYQYSLDGINYQPGALFSNLTAGTYTIAYKEANGCAGTLPVIISQPAAITQTITKQDARCNGQSNGLISVSAGGGTPGYQYSIDGSTYQTATNFTVAAGNYIVSTKDAAGCIATSPVAVSQPGLLSTVLQIKNATCNGGADGSLTAATLGGTSPYLYSIDGTNFQTAPVFNVSSGLYNLVSKDANNCTATTSATVSITNNLLLSASADTTICEGGIALLTASSNATQLTWSPAFNLSTATTSSTTAAPKDTTNYVVTASFGVCTAKDSVTVNVNKAPVANAGGNDEICFGQSYVLQAGGGVQYHWSPVTYFTNGSTASMQNPTITPDKTITYLLDVTDALGCSSLQPASVIITVTPPIVVKASPRDTVVARGDVIILRASSPVVDYIWSPALGLDNPSKQTPVATVDRDITYIVTAYTGAGCKGSDTVKIKVYNGPDLYVPTGFTPNGDGKNDVLLPFPVGIKQLNFFRVYNRWGQIIFQSNSLNKGWDGKVGGILQPIATYVWIAEAVTKDNVVITKRGTATLIR